MLLPGDAPSYRELVKGFAWEIPNSFNIAEEICDRHARRQPNAAAIIEDRQNASTRIYTYEELQRWSARIAGGLRAHGVLPGSRVAVCLPQGAEALAVHLAVFRLGAILVPIAAVFSGEGLRYRLADSGCMLIVCTAAGADQLDQAGRPETLSTVVTTQPAASAETCLASLAEQGVPVDGCVAMPADAPAIIFYTSGTTGPAKGAVMAARLLFALLPGFQTVYDLAPRVGDVYWTPSDWAWLGALELVYPACYFGHPVVACAARFSIEDAYRILSQYSVTCTFLAPTVLRRMRGNPPPPEMPFRLRTISTGGEALATEVQGWTLRQFGASLNDNFGLTEANHLAQGCQHLYTTPAGALGLPVVGRKVAVVDPSGHPVPPGSLGELVMPADDPIVMLGYWNKPEKTAEKIRDGWFWTGDIGYQDAQGFLYFVSRADDMLKVAGMQVAAEEVEKALLSHPDVVEAGVCGDYDARGEPSIAAFVRLREASMACSALTTTLQQIVKERVGAHAYPRVIEYVRDFPMTSTGKIQRKELSRHLRQQRSVQAV